MHVQFYFENAQDEQNHEPPMSEKLWADVKLFSRQETFSIFVCVVIKMVKNIITYAYTSIHFQDIVMSEFVKAKENQFTYIEGIKISKSF